MHWHQHKRTIMSNLNHDILKERLLEIGYVDAPITEKTIEHLMQLKGAAATMLEQWYQSGRVPNFDAIEGIDKRFLRDYLKMKDPAIIMAYGMLLENPKYNAMLFKKKAAELGKNI